MNWTRILAGGVVSGIVVNLVDFVLHGQIMANTYKKYDTVFSQTQANPGYFFAAAILIGVALIGLGVLAIGAVGWLTPIGLWGLLLVAAVAAWVLVAGRGGAQLGVPGPREEKCRYRGLWPIALLIGVALLISFVAALSPATQSDGMRYHFFGPQEYLRAGRIHYIPFSAFTNFPLLTEMLFVLGMGLGNDVAATLFHWVHLPLALSLIAALSSSLAGSDPDRQRKSGALATMLFATTPVPAIVAG